MTVGIIGGNWDSGNWVKLYNEKRQDLEEQQLHLSIGLQKIRETYRLRNYRLVSLLRRMNWNRGTL